MGGWETLRVVYDKEKRQRYEEGYDVSSVPSLPLDIKNEWDMQEYMKVFDHLPLRKPYGYIESNEFAPITKDFRRLIPLNPSIQSDYFYGALLGRCVGCMLGKPLELGPYFWESSLQKPGWKNVKRWFEGADQYPIRDYVPSRSRASDEGLYVGYETCLRGNIRFVETDDDIRYTLLSLLLLEAKGKDFTPFDVGKLWHNHLPYQMVCTAETQAYLNFAEMTHHLSPELIPYTTGIQDYVRTHHNPYREWIGAQIRVDGYAYAAAGNPLLAAELAFKDASFSHTKNGVYGAMFCAAMIASAFIEKDVERCIQQALLVIPQSSRLYDYIERTIAIVKRQQHLESMVEEVWEFLLDFDPTHAINNTCACVAAILFSKGDFDVAVSTAVLFGLDTDCNGATVGSFMGALGGSGAIKVSWSAPLNDTILSMLPTFHPASIRHVAQRFYTVYQELLKK